MKTKKCGVSEVAKGYIEIEDKGGIYKMPISQKVVTHYTCSRCGHEWIPRSAELPVKCPNPRCATPYWNKPRKIKKDDK